MKDTIDSMMKEFCFQMVPFGYLDMQCALRILQEIDEPEYFLVDAIRDFTESTGSKMDEIDIVYILLDEIFQRARNNISEKIDVDISDLGFYTYGNYMASSYDCSSEAYDELEEKTKDHVEELRECKFTSYFLDSISLF